MTLLGFRTLLDAVTIEILFEPEFRNLDLQGFLKKAISGSEHNIYISMCQYMLQIYLDNKVTDNTAIDIYLYIFCFTSETFN